jgi:MATE family multidrug resistance protein
MPLIGSNLAQVGIGMTDILMLGWYSVDALAAVTLAGSMYFTLYLVGSGFAWAVMPIVAKSSEEGDDVQLRRATRMGLWLSMIFAALVLPPLLFFEPIMVALGQKPEVASLGQHYLRIAAWGMIPGLIVMTLRSYLSALERTQIVLWVTLGTAVLNAALNYVFIFGNFGMPELGARGAAIASLGVTITSTLALAAYAVHQFPDHQLFRRIWRPDWSAFAQVFALGWPIMLTTLAETGLFSASAFMMGWLGKAEVAAHGIALQLASATFVVHLGLSQAATVRVGRAVGRRDADGLRRGALVAFVMSVVFALITVAIFFAIPEMLVGVFLGFDVADRETILAIGASLLIVAAFFQLADGAQVMGLGLLRGLQDTQMPMIYAAISYWIVGIPISYALGFSFGFRGQGVWAGLVIGLMLAALLLMTRFLRQSRHLDHLAVQAD